MKENVPQCEYPLPEVFNALRWFVRAGCSWRMMPNDLPPWYVVQRPTSRWVKAGCFEAMSYDARAAYDGYNRKTGSKVHIAVKIPWDICSP
jgi:transposase